MKIENCSVYDTLKNAEGDLTVKLYHFSKLLWELPLSQAKNARGVHGINNFTIDFNEAERTVVIKHYTK